MHEVITFNKYAPTKVQCKDVARSKYFVTTLLLLSRRTAMLLVMYHGKHPKSVDTSVEKGLVGVAMHSCLNRETKFFDKLIHNFIH